MRPDKVEAGRRAPTARTFFTSPLEELLDADAEDRFDGVKADTEASDAARRLVRFRGARVVTLSREMLPTGVSLPLKYSGLGKAGRILRIEDASPRPSRCEKDR